MKNFSEKIVDNANFNLIRNELKKEDKKVVMCHGVYDLFHYGHLKHLEDAKRQGDILVVSVTSEPYVNKGPDRPYYKDQQRLEMLANLEVVDYVLLSQEPTAKTNIRLVRPDIFVKGQEFQSGDDGMTGNVKAEIEEVECLGGKVYFSQGEVHSSSKLLNNYFNALPDEVLEIAVDLKQKYGDFCMEKLEKFVDSFSDLKVLVIGDIIIDEYVFCQAQGLTSKDTVISTRYEGKECYLGGALAIARHIANFSDHVALFSMTGPEDEYTRFIDKELPGCIERKIFSDTHYVTPVKRRFLKKHPQRDEYDKLFSINVLSNENDKERINYDIICEKLGEILPEYDLVVVCDYGHGLINPDMQAVIEKKSRFLSLNCQTNSSNFGTNLITKYRRADTFALDERELKLAYGQQAVTHSWTLLERLVEELNAKIGWLTIGANGAVSMDIEGECSKIPALTLHVKDTVGAGDAFFSLSSMCAARGVPADLATLLSNGAGAIKTHMVGNSGTVGKKELLKFINTILNV